MLAYVYNLRPQNIPFEEALPSGAEIFFFKRAEIDLRSALFHV